MNEILVTVKGKVEPDLTKHVKRTQRNYPDWYTGEDIPAKSSAYAVSERYGHKLYKRYLTEASMDALGIPKP